jgi:hypothetical protein
MIEKAETLPMTALFVIAKGKKNERYAAPWLHLVSCSEFPES